jgi:hypothetical protein
MLALGFRHVSQRLADVGRSLFLNLWHPNAGVDGFECTQRGCPNRRTSAHPCQESGLPSR